MMNEQQNEEITMSLVNLIGHLLVKWKIVLLIVIATTAIGGIYGLNKQKVLTETAAKNEADTEKEKDTKKETTHLDLKTLTAKAAAELTEEQKAEAEEYYSRILDYESIIEDQRIYNDNSYIMSLDPNTAVSYYMQYLLETDVQNANSVYNAYTFNEEDSKMISDFLGSDIGKMGLNEGISISASSADPSYKVDLERTDRLAGDVKEEFKSIITVTIYAPDKETCAEIAKVVDVAVDRKTKLLDKSGSSAKCVLIDEGYGINAGTSITKAKTDKNDLLVDVVNGEPGYIKNLLSAVDPKEKAYIDLLRGIMPQEEPENEETAETDEELEELEEPGKSPVFYAFIGLLAGFVVSICGFAVVHAINGKVHTTGEIRSRFGIEVLQTLMTEELEDKLSKSDPITRYGYKLIGIDFETSDCLAILMEELENITSDKNIRNVYVAADRSSNRVVSLVKEISEASPDVTYIEGSLKPNADDIKNLLSADGVLLLSVIDGISKKTIKTFADICRRNSRSIIGAVPVRDVKVTQ